MNRSQLKALLWKELEEDRWFFYGGAVAFIVLPVFGSVEEYLYTLVVALGAVLAILVGVGTACRDLRGGVETFWRSRPISPARWLSIKYLIGLGVVLAIHTAALGVQLGITGFVYRSVHGPSVVALLFNTPALMLIYSVAFFLGCLVRDAVHASILSLAAVLLIYCFPVVVPQASWLSPFVMIRYGNLVVGHHGAGTAMEHWSALPFLRRSQWYAAVMVGGSILAVVAGVVGVMRDCRLRVNAQLMAWTLGCLALLIFGTGAEQLGTNLYIDRIVELNPREPRQAFVGSVELSGDRGVARVLRMGSAPGWRREALRLEVDTIDMGRPDPLGPKFGSPIFAGWGLESLIWSPASPRVLYQLESDPLAQATTQGAAPGTRASATRPAPSYLWHNMLLTYIDGMERPTSLTLPPDPAPAQLTWATFVHGKLYCLGGFAPVVSIDLRDPAHPRVDEVSEGRSPLGESGYQPRGQSLTRFTGLIYLPRIPGLTARQRLDAWASIRHTHMEGDLFVSVDENTVWRLKHLTETTAEYEKVGSLESISPLARLASSVLTNRERDENQFLGFGRTPSLLQDGFFYVSRSGFESNIDVYDLHDPAHPEQVGRFAMLDDVVGDIAPLPEGRILVTGYRLYVLEAPRR